MPRNSASPHTKHLTHEEKLRIYTLYHDAKKGLSEIAALTGFTKMQIRGVIRSGTTTVAKRSGRPRALTEEEEKELVEFVTGSREGRRMSFLELSVTLFENRHKMWAIKKALYRLGFRRCLAWQKPPISEKNRQLRLAWAREHVNWTPEQWGKILWTDETWVSGGSHRRVFVTRRPGEEWDPTCIVERHQRKRGWMFWGCFSASGKGPGIFWEKDWGTINANSYCQHIVPVIDRWIRSSHEDPDQRLILMQDSAPGHAALETRKDLEQRGIRVLKWPPYSPDLNPIESCWNWMKDWIQEHHGLEENPGYNRLREYVLEAWNELPDSYLQDLLASMPQRCQAVIDANGMHIKY